MSEISGFFPDDGSGSREYTSDFLADVLSSMASNGIFMPGLNVTAGDGMNITINPGVGVINGFFYTLTEGLTLSISPSDSVSGRRDSVMIRYDILSDQITAQVITGTFSSNPSAPDVVRNDTIYDLKIAEIDIMPGALAIKPTLIIDTRLNKSVCGQSTFGGQDVADNIIDQSTGNWIPELYIQAVQATLNQTRSVGIYKRLGNMVYVRGNITFTSTPSQGYPEASYYVIGISKSCLPFAPKNENITSDLSTQSCITGNYMFSNVAGSYGANIGGGNFKLFSPNQYPYIAFNEEQTAIIASNNRSGQNIGFSFYYYTDE